MRLYRIDQGHAPAQTNLWHPPTSSCHTSSGSHPAIRLAGPRSGTHGGARDRARQLARRHFVIGQGLIRQSVVRASLVGAPWGRARRLQTRITPSTTFQIVVLSEAEEPPALHTTTALPAKCRRTHEVSSCRTPIRYPRWGSGQGAGTDATPFRNRPRASHTTTRTGVSCGRPWGVAGRG